MSRLARIAGGLYLAFLVAEDYPEQCPEHKLARGLDLLWLLIPFGGFIVFCEVIKARWVLAGRPE